MLAYKQKRNNLNRADTAACVTHINTATDLMLKNLLVKTSSGGEVVMTRQAGATYWGLTNLNSPDQGFKGGIPSSIQAGRTVGAML